jgi:hypothetical protein
VNGLIERKGEPVTFDIRFLAVYARVRAWQSTPCPERLPC